MSIPYVINNNVASDPLLYLICYLILTMLEQLLLPSPNSPIKSILRLQTNTKL